MPRQNALERHLQKDASGLVQPVEVMNIIPTARQEKNRAPNARAPGKRRTVRTVTASRSNSLPARDLSASLSADCF